MADPHGEKLIANTSAAEARRRVKGFGHGVRKVHSAGKGRAVIIHTATGRHLEELKAQFADVGTEQNEEGGTLTDEGPSDSGARGRRAARG